MNVTHPGRRRLLRFGIVGVVSNLALYLGFLLLIHLAVQPLWAAVTCYCAGICTSYILNRSWTFESRDVHSEDLPKFLLAHGVGFGSTIVVLNFLLAWLSPAAAQLVNITVTALMIYGTLLLLGFGGARAR